MRLAHGPDPPDPAEEEDDEFEHKFWSEQPVMRRGAPVPAPGYIDPAIPVTPPPPDPSPLPASFSWSTIDITNTDSLREVYGFLAAHYVENDDHRLRFLLSPELLQWALTPPGAIPDWIFGVRTRTGVLTGFISGVPIIMRLGDDVQPWAAVNFLCVHAKLRTKNLASVLISELARRVRGAHVYRAVFSGDKLPTKPFCKSNYHHRPLNLKKMDESGFYPIDPQKLGSARKRFALPAVIHGNCRPMIEEDVDAVVELLQATSGQFIFDVVWTPEVVRHLLLPREGILYTYVIPSAKGPRAVFSFYIMGWKTLDAASKVHGDIRAAYIWYVASDGVSITSLLADLLNKAVNDAHADVANALALAGTQEGLITNKFESGLKALQFYSYNFFVPPMDQSQMRFIFV
jgi:glycylpeptide N-tetradecanoyltransferase